MTTLTPFAQFIQHKHDEARRAAPHADVRLIPEAEGYAAYGRDAGVLAPFARKPVAPCVTVATENVAPLIRAMGRAGHSVAILDKVRLSAHGGWKLVLVAEIPATGTKVEEDEDFA